jgi:predicted N-formylglutamate amidohydrolase
VHDEAVEIIAGAGPIVLTCEHASMDLPSPWVWPPHDAWIVGSHWSWDPGAAEITRGLAARLGAPSVLSRFTRLLCDPNRAETDPTLFRTIADGHVLHMNQDIGSDERDRRLTLLYRAYHEAVDLVVAANPGRLLLSIHTFTPNYEGNEREVELGVLFDDQDELAVDFAMALTDRGHNVWLNEPYSGKDGLIYSAGMHARKHGRAALELEVRNDLATAESWRSTALDDIAAALRELLAG